MNRLQFETSPYLLQHARNPVDWYAWKPEAFERARIEDKPILVSIGYSTCHWCHVMERESFENQDIADLMNTHFINIKVDREERPDVDAIYMEACQIISGNGGWPLNCFLTPAGKPFFAGTYFPPVPAYQRPSWGQVLLHFAHVWRTQREKVEEQAERLMAYLLRNDQALIAQPRRTDFAMPAGQDSAQDKFGYPLLENIYYRMRDDFDRVEGGFGAAPKFPSTMAIQFLLHYHYYTKNQEALEHATLTLDKMLLGGIYDQIGGGFARYATDRAWLVPHFEKMLYDNALMVSVLAEAYQLTRNKWYRETIEQTLEFVRREMTHPAGGFFSAIDADSEGEEGKYYIWKKQEIEQILGEHAEIFCRYYGVTEQGNWEEHNILYRSMPASAFAAANHWRVGDFEKMIKKCNRQLLAARRRRVPPGLDDKIILGWNALMVSGLAAAYTALGHERYRAAAVKNLHFLTQNLYHAEQGWQHTWRAGQAQYPAFLDDMAFLIAAHINVYEITFDVRYVQQASEMIESTIEKFWDEANSLFFYTPAQQHDIIFRKKDLYDNATPSGNSTMVLNLKRLGLLLHRPEWLKMARKMLEQMAGTVEQYPRSFDRWAIGIITEVEPIPEIAVVGEGAIQKAAAIKARFLPNRVLAASETETDTLPLLAGKTGGTTARIYVCQQMVCQHPVETVEAMGIW